MKARPVVFGLLILAIMGAVALRMRGHPQAPLRIPQGPPPEALAERRAAVAASLRAGPATRPPAQALDPWSADFRDVEPTLRTRALAGDIEAAFLLGVRGVQCLQMLRGPTRAEREAEFLDELAQEDASNPHAAIRRRNIESQSRTALSQYDACASIGERRLADSLAWLERAGHAGSDLARSQFAAHAFDEWPTPESMVPDIEEATRRRRLAREWLEGLVANGREDALNQYAGALEGNGPLYRRDAVAARTYDYVLGLVRARRMGTFDALWARGPERYGTELSAADWSRVHREGQRIFRLSFANAPLYPR